jgi:uncharacterized DUF497 family protein
VIFVWDSGKASANLKKHGVDVREAATVFDDPRSTTCPDVDHSAGRRFVMIGASAPGRVLVVALSRTKPSNYQRQVATRQEDSAKKSDDSNRRTSTDTTRFDGAVSVAKQKRSRRNEHRSDRSQMVEAFPTEAAKRGASGCVEHRSRSAGWRRVA